MRVRGETTIYSTAMGDVLLEREFNISVIWYIACADWFFPLGRTNIADGHIPTTEASQEEFSQRVERLERV